MRTLSGIILGLAVFAAGCGGANTAAPEPKTTLPTDPGPRPDGPSPPPDPKKETSPPPDPKREASPPPAAVAAWELDTAKHAIPDKPANGQLGGKPFAPTAVFVGDTLTFRTGDKDGAPDQEIALKFSAELLKKLPEGVKVLVRAEQPVGPDVPELATARPSPKSGDQPVYEGFLNGYALTLELGKKADGKVPGKVFLALPVTREGGEKVFLAGTFAATWIRPPGQPPGADEAPFVQGSLTVPVGVEVRVGYAGLVAGGNLAHDATVAIAFRETFTATRSDANKPRATVLESSNKTTGRYDHTRLDPGRYLVYAAPTGGPVRWQWVTVEPTGQLTVDFALDPAKAGGLEVTVPAGVSGPVSVAPAEDGKSWDANLPAVAHALGLQAEPKDNKATFAKLGPGRYEVRAGDLSAAVEVKSGETAKVELKK
jgi:hypothetical protein